MKVRRNGFQIYVAFFSMAFQKMIRDVYVLGFGVNTGILRNRNGSDVAVDWTHCEISFNVHQLLFHPQDLSTAAMQAAMYSAFMVEVETDACILYDQETSLFPQNWQVPLVLLVDCAGGRVCFGETLQLNAGDLWVLKPEGCRLSYIPHNPLDRMEMKLRRV